MPEDLRPPYRIQFDNARDPYTARNALGFDANGGISGGSGGGFVLTAGDTMTGDLTIAKANPGIILNKTASGQAAYVLGQMGGASRWALNLGDTVAEGGANTGSDYRLFRFNDAGSPIDSPLVIVRSTGIAAFVSTPTFPTATAGDSSTKGATTAFVQGAVGAAWTAWTPTFTASSGTITSTTINRARYVQVGKAVTAFVDVTITNAGTGAGALIFTLPVTGAATVAGTLSGREMVVVGYGLCGNTFSTTQGAVVRHDSSSPITTNHRLAFTTIYEAA